MGEYGFSKAKNSTRLRDTLQYFVVPKAQYQLHLKEGLKRLEISGNLGLWDLRGDLIREVVSKGPIILSIATFSSSLFHVIITVEYKVIAASVPLEVY